MYVENNGVKIWYEVHGQGESSIVLVPGFQIVCSEAFKRSFVPFLSRHMRVVTFDLRGSGKSDKTENGHDLDQYADDLGAVAKAAGLTRFGVFGLSLGSSIAVRYCTRNPQNVTHLVLLSGSAKMIRSETYPAGLPRDLLSGLLDMWRAAPEDMLKGFIDVTYSEKHALRAKELTWKWAHETSPRMWELGFSVATLSDIDEDLHKIKVPTLIVHGSEDKTILPQAAEYLHEKILGSRLVLVPEAGHGFCHTWPQVARETLDFIHPLPKRNMSRVSEAPPKLLWISSPIGLGHVKRDMVIATQVRKQFPRLQIDWLAGGPVRSVLEAMGETIHPMSDGLWDENACFENCSSDYALNPTEAYWAMDDLLANNFMVFSDAAVEGDYKAIVGDEAWEIHTFLHYNPTLKTAPFIFMTDFIGTRSVSEDKKEKTRVNNLIGSWLEMRELHPEASDLSIFIGNEEDLPDEPFAEGFPNIREWGKKHFVFPGYVLPMDIDEYADRQHSRKELGFAADDKILIIAVGGTSVGRPLIEKCLQAQSELEKRVPKIKTVVMTGARIDQKSFNHAGNVVFFSYVENPLKLYGMCDIAVIQGGLSTAMELTAMRRPFLYFPLKNHFEQQYFVDFRLKRYNAGIRMDFETASATDIANMVAAHLDQPAEYKVVDRDGALRVANMILDVIQDRKGRQAS